MKLSVIGCLLLATNAIKINCSQKSTNCMVNLDQSHREYVKAKQDHQKSPEENQQHHDDQSEKAAMHKVEHRMDEDAKKAEKEEEDHHHHSHDADADANMDMDANVEHHHNHTHDDNQTNDMDDDGSMNNTMDNNSTADASMDMDANTDGNENHTDDDNATMNLNNDGSMDDNSTSNDTAPTGYHCSPDLTDCRRYSEINGTDYCDSNGQDCAWPDPAGVTNMTYDDNSTMNASGDGNSSINASAEANMTINGSAGGNSSNSSNGTEGHCNADLTDCRSSVMVNGSDYCDASGQDCAWPDPRNVVTYDTGAEEYHCNADLTDCRNYTSINGTDYCNGDGQDCAWPNPAGDANMTYGNETVFYHDNSTNSTNQSNHDSWYLNASVEFTATDLHTNRSIAAVACANSTAYGIPTFILGNETAIAKCATGLANESLTLFVHGNSTANMDLHFEKDGHRAHGEATYDIESGNFDIIVRKWHTEMKVPADQLRASLNHHVHGSLDAGVAANTDKQVTVK